MEASASSTAATPPSTVFSMASIAAMETPPTTSSRASPMLFTGRQVAPCAAATWPSATSVKVPAGPR